MTKIENIATLGVLIFLGGCAALNSPFFDTEKDTVSDLAPFNGYQPIDPLPPKDLVRNGGDEIIPWSSMDVSAIRKALPNQTSTTIIKKEGKDGKITYLSSSVAAELGKYEVIIDYAKYRSEFVEGGFGKIGVGLRIRANIETLKSAVNLNGLFALGVAASQEQVRGTITVDVIGIDSPGVNSLLPISLKLDETSIQTSLQALASIQTKIYDDKVTLTPQLLAIKLERPIVGSIDLSTYNARSQIIRELQKL